MLRGVSVAQSASSLEPLAAHSPGTKTRSPASSPSPQPLRGLVEVAAAAATAAQSAEDSSASSGFEPVSRARSDKELAAAAVSPSMGEAEDHAVAQLLAPPTVRRPGSPVSSEGGSSISQPGATDLGAFAG